MDQDNRNYILESTKIAKCTNTDVNDIILKVKKILKHLSAMAPPPKTNFPIATEGKSCDSDSPFSNSFLTPSYNNSSHLP